MKLDPETGEVALRSDEDIFLLGDEDPLIVNKEFVLDKPLKRQKNKSRGGVRPSSSDPDSPSSILLQPSFARAQSVQRDDDDDVSITDSTMSLAASSSDQNLLSSLRGQDLRKKKALPRANAKKKVEDRIPPSIGNWGATRLGGLPPGITVSEEGVYSDVHGVQWTYVDSIGIDHSSRFQIIFSHDPEASDQMKTVIGEYLLEAPGLAKSPPPDPDGWLYCVPGELKTRNAPLRIYCLI